MSTQLCNIVVIFNGKGGAADFYHDAVVCDRHHRHMLFFSVVFRFFRLKETFPRRSTPDRHQQHEVLPS